MTKLIFGCGYLGERVAQRWREVGHKVTIVTRSQERADEFVRQGYDAIVGDVTQRASLAGLPAAETVLFAVGYDRTANQTIEDVYTNGMNNVLATLPPETGRFIYISTTGVYGDAAGGWIDEETPTNPQREGGKASLAAEQALAEHPLSKNAIILRLAGIYGPGRIPFRSLLRAGAPIPAVSDGFLNLIHVVDAASVVLCAADANIGKPGKGPRVYCVSDGQPVQRGEYYREVARQIGAPEPTFVDPEPDSPRAARAGSDRRVGNKRMLAELGVQLIYPDYCSGLRAILG
jgi:nucleoside-diphosphate-sugar epimerase